MDVIMENTPADFWSILPSDASPIGIGWRVRVFPSLYSRGDITTLIFTNAARSL
ncbi:MULTISPECIES: hypothetical protein [unclassified Methanoculleus]|uniref:hypothetical protein n=1 Tax=unclassified Methanoculleus TaxID=2619537 RepID=UPI0025EC5AA3|nr:MULTISPECIES: hypothetical protein [unclassified Methanoculleus]MCK9317187.1 hypothetical protein [Methanoculleus sp.]MDD2253758.1 hypothetical protein [Methanoculleus sp.]MDD2787753.1 hypothetical protein [Methanoculleus sp.]MDD3216596.1 hypothetical protein [Methanoculleus sp.]MDD4314619.1 hypothetical protein [Methanoculleus sp.]